MEISIIIIIIIIIHCSNDDDVDFFWYSQKVKVPRLKTFTSTNNRLKLLFTLSWSYLTRETDTNDW